MSADYRQYGVASLDPNTNDPNFALSRLNTQGIRINLGYNITDWLKAEVWYYGAWNLDKNIHNLNGTLGQQRHHPQFLRRERRAKSLRPVDFELLTARCLRG